MELKTITSVANSVIPEQIRTKNNNQIYFPRSQSKLSYHSFYFIRGQKFISTHFVRHVTLLEFRNKWETSKHIHMEIHISYWRWNCLSIMVVYSSVFRYRLHTYIQRTTLKPNNNNNTTTTSQLHIEVRSKYYARWFQHFFFLDMTYVYFLWTFWMGMIHTVDATGDYTTGFAFYPCVTIR